MNIGALVKINDLNKPDPKRMIGTVIKNDMYDVQFNQPGEKITEVLWNGGHISWILSSRLSNVENNPELWNVAMDS
jgi:hypothetical protein